MSKRLFVYITNFPVELKHNFEMYFFFCRIYNLFEADNPLSIVNINTGVVSFTSSPSKTFVGVALGETAVAFDFGLPLHLKPKKRPYQTVDSGSTLEVWPVYCVRGNGDILIVYSNLSSNR